MSELLCDYFDEWADVYKRDTVRHVTFVKYLEVGKRIRRDYPKLMLDRINRRTYQSLMNHYAEQYERHTVMDMHRIIKPCLLDAVDEGLLDRDPTKRVRIGGKPRKSTKSKFLEESELNRLYQTFDLTGPLHKGMYVNWDVLLYFISKTGFRYAEALGVTPEDFDWKNGTVTINKTWDYKYSHDFMPTKNKSSMRTVKIDSVTADLLRDRVMKSTPGRPIFVPDEGRTAVPAYGNKFLVQHCEKAGIPAITIHGLRHTHASILISHNVSIQSVSRRLGHANTVTTQKTYIHLLKSMEVKADSEIENIMSKI